MGYWLIGTLSLSHPLRPPRCLPQPRQIRLDFPCLTEVHQIKGAVTNSIISSTCTRIEPPVAGVAITIDRTRVRGPVWRGIESERSDCRSQRYCVRAPGMRVLHSGRGRVPVLRRVRVRDALLYVCYRHTGSSKITAHLFDYSHGGARASFQGEPLYGLHDCQSVRTMTFPDLSWRTA